MKLVPCNFTGSGLLEAHNWFSLDFTHVPFPFADFALYPFTGTYHSHEHDYILSLVSPLSDHQTWGWSWGPSDTALYLPISKIIVNNRLSSSVLFHL